LTAAAEIQLGCNCLVNNTSIYIFQLQNEIILADTEADDEVCLSPFGTFYFRNQLCADKFTFRAFYIIVSISEFISKVHNTFLLTKFESTETKQ